MGGVTGEKPKCLRCTLLFELYERTPKTGRDYWLMTELFVELHGGRDWCDGQDRIDRKAVLEPLMKAQGLIPRGIYCYDESGNCPFWECRQDRPEQENGYCHYLRRGDWENNDLVGLLWDQIKECGINEDYEWDGNGQERNTQGNSPGANINDKTGTVPS